MIMQKKPYISVIINNYNYARFLTDAIDSVLAQDYTDYEVIVVDDASTDHSREVIESYGDRIKPVFQLKNCGQGAAFNAGFQASKGELICFLDADDIYYKNKLSILSEAAVSNPDAVLIYHRGKYINIHREIIGEVFPKKIMQGDVSKRVQLYCETLFPPTSFLSFRRTFLARVLPLTPYLNRIDADFPLQMLAGIMGNVAAINQPLCYYRLHGDNWFSNNEFVQLDFETIRRLTRRTERAFHYINKKLADTGRPERINLLNHRFHSRNLFMIHQIGWKAFLKCALLNPNFISLWDRLDYIIFGILRRRKFKAVFAVDQSG
jgi:glycosyltransferase involved in cell wall biosynthesis